ncbi:subtilisin [Myriangium duriaei CBS 260.36]|uniref:Subtilisin n=1 Tax=Myriangium duriaei CBS 260.36 TaxID=1168546 RepID=A0A9P4ITD5_9PEZI|nr:subtilisin [Myriangium duriaei CBS 260.36]
MKPLVFNGNRVRLDDVTSGPNWSSFASLGTDYIIIECKDTLSQSQKAQLEHEGAVIQEYVGNNSYLAFYQPNDLTNIKSLEFVAAVALYPAKAKLVGHLADKTLVYGSDPKDLVVTLHERGDDEVDQKLARTAVAQVTGLSEDSIKITNNTLHLSLSPDQLKALSSVDAIKSIEEAKTKILCNDIARKILGVGTKVNGTIYDGGGETVAVADTGLDSGDVATLHPAFKGRIKALVGISRPGKSDDPIGHGTHVCGSILGVSVPESSNSNIQGTAPGASLVMQSLTDGKGVKSLSPSELEKLFLDAYEKYGARIHSNSWQNSWQAQQQPYNDESRTIDNCVWNNKDLLICFAAGNDGIQQPTNTVGAMAAAKNCLTVGAVDSTRASLEGALQINTDRQNDPTQIAYYSSRGPTAEQRIKPDVVAPGTTILSARSTKAPPFTKYGVSPDPYWTFNTGTSMATPLVAGCAAALRQYLGTIGISNPSAALLKALLINGAYALHHAHNGSEGFGCVNLANTMIPRLSEDAGFIEGEAFTDKGQNVSVLTVAPPARNGVTLKVTLVYTDYPGQALQNNLNLQVTTSDGSKRNGNMASSSRIDWYNNVEQVIWKGIPAGKATLEVVATSITFAPQDFALVWRVIPSEG